MKANYDYKRDTNLLSIGTSNETGLIVTGKNESKL